MFVGVRMRLTVTTGDLLRQPTEAIVNPWNQNIWPWWLLFPSGVSGAIKREGGTQIFHELRQKGRIPLGGAVATAAGRLPYKAIIHVASIAWWGRSSLHIVRTAVEQAVSVAEARALRSLAFPILGAGAGGLRVQAAEGAMVQGLERRQSALEVIIVRPR